ncbi:isopentenyl phosphate kinase family protein [Methanothermococcus sp. SCGC AD-155-M21]|nr:isopentenyl phosphate kinase family protein [Methanothermococcus sp. SCGC AD-155-M21]
MFGILKLGGSILCNKDIPYSINWDNLNRISMEIKQSIEEYSKKNEKLNLIIIHGGGSFGHPVAKKYINKNEFKNMNIGFWDIQKSMRKFNNIVIDALHEYDIPAVSIQPSSFVAFKGEDIYFDTYVIEGMLKRGLIPVIHGDITLSNEMDYKIFSGDHALPYLSKKLKPDLSLHASDVDGVLDFDNRVIKHITSENINEVLKYLSPSNKEDVTGGMYLKVMEAYKLGVKTIIFNGNKKGNIYKGLMGKEIGTKIN